MPKLIVANWKMNPSTEAEAILLAKATDAPGVVICPPFPFISAVAGVIKDARLGAQDVFWQESAGPYTGEVSAAELKNLCVSYVIIGHSERRANLGETDEMVAKKIVSALHAGIIPILCIGENLAEKQNGKKEEVLAREVKVGLHEAAKELAGKQIYIAYEPIWAISTSQNGTHAADTPDDTLGTIQFIKDELAKLDYKFDVKFLYGGSVNSKNAKDFLGKDGIDGALVGGASLRSEEFMDIVRLAL